MKYLIFISLLIFSNVTFAQSQFRYEGYIVNGGTAVTASAQRFTVTLRKPGCASNLGLTTWDSGATIAINNGEFNLVPTFNEALLSTAMDPNQIFGCTVGSARNLEITWVDQSRTFVVALQDAPRASFSNLAGNSNTLGTRSQDQFLKIDNYAGQTPLSNAQVNSLLNLVNGTSTLYSAPATAAGGDATGTLSTLTVTGLRGRGIGAATPATGQVLKYNGTTWEPAADDSGAAPSNASYAAKGVVQFDTSEAISGMTVTAGVAKLADTIAAGGPIGTASTIPVITYDAKGRLTNVTTAAVNDPTKLSLAGGTMSGSINMSLQNITNATSVAATHFSGRNMLLNDNDTNIATIRSPTNLTADYTLTLPMTAPTNGFVLSTDGTGQLSWVATSTPLTTRGDILTRNSTTEVRLPVGSNGQILSANSAASTGLEWVNAPAGDITSVNAGNGLINGEVSGDVTLAVDTGLGINKIPQVGGTALGANGVVVANGTATALTSLNCANGEVIKFDASGFATCGTDNDITPPFSVAGTNNIFLGTNAGGVTPGTGQSNVGVGTLALSSISTGINNTSVGFQAGRLVTNGSGHTLIGSMSAANLASSAIYNTFVGAESGVNATSGSNNTFIGFQTGANVTSGGNNTFIGFQAGRDFTTGNNTVIIGRNSGNQINGQSNSVLISDGSGTPKLFADNTGNVGIGTLNPSGKLHTSYDGANMFIVDSYSSISPMESSYITMQRSRGTASVPQSVVTGDILGGWGASGSDSIGPNYISTAGIHATAEGTFSLSSHPTSLSFSTTPPGSTTKQERIKILPNGNVGIGNNAPSATLDVMGSFKLGTGSASLTKIVKCNPSITIPDIAIPTGTSTIYPTATSSCLGVTNGMIMNCNFVSTSGTSAPFSFIFVIVDTADEANGRIRIRVTNPTTTSQPSGGAMTVNFSCIGMN